MYAPCAGAVRCGAQLAVLLSADSAALGMWRDGVLERHKVLTGYTIRRSAGKAQLTHLRRWGALHGKSADCGGLAWAVACSHPALRPCVQCTAVRDAGRLGNPGPCRQGRRGRCPRALCVELLPRCAELPYRILLSWC